MIKRFIIYGLLGLCIEITWTGFHSLFIGNINLTGQTSLWMFIVYGSAVFIMEPIHRKTINFRWYTRGILYVVAIYLIELSSGLLFRLILGSAPWNYTNALSFMGLIRFDYAPAWFVAGILFEFVHNTLEKYQII